MVLEVLVGELVEGDLVCARLVVERSNLLQPQQPSEQPIFVLLDASRLGLESMAEILEAIPPEASLMLVGDPNEGPRSGHGQPFRDLVSAALFQCVRLTGTVAQVETVTATAPARRSALSWRLRRGAGLSSKFRWGPIATIDVDGEMS